MTREETLHDMYISQDLFKEFNSVDEVVWSRSKVLNRVSKIYDDFESRTCENCKHWGYQDEEAMYEDCNLIEHIYSPTWFGCKQFIKKEN